METKIQTNFGYTGQRDNAGIGMMDYHARWYAPSTGRFTATDTIVPNPLNPQSLNRYSYTNNNPVKYTDPSGHYAQVEDGDSCGKGIEVDGKCVKWVGPDYYDYGDNPNKHPCHGHVIGSNCGQEKTKKGTSPSLPPTLPVEITPSSSEDDEYLVIDLVWGALVTGSEGLQSVKRSMPSKSFKIKNFLGGKYNVYTVTWFKGWHAHDIRAFGRASDDMAPITIPIGLAITVAPNVIENIQEGVGANEYIGDLVIDTGGFIASEIAGDAAGWFVLGGGATFGASIPVQLGADYLAGKAWELLLEPFRP